MESAIERAGFEVDVTLEDCMGKRTKFYQCVVEKKNELTKSLDNEGWRNYYNSVNKIQVDCFQGLDKCQPFFSLTDIKY